MIIGFVAIITTKAKILYLRQLTLFNGLGRSRMISGTQTVNYSEATTIRKEDGEKEKSNKKRSEIRTKAFEETKLLNFYNVGGIRFNNQLIT